jgi:hypothetical protein
MPCSERAVELVARWARSSPDPSLANDAAPWPVTPDPGLRDVVATSGIGTRGAVTLTTATPIWWEASLVDQLVKGTVGYRDEYLVEVPAGQGK